MGSGFKAFVGIMLTFIFLALVYLNLMLTAVLGGVGPLHKP